MGLRFSKIHFNVINLSNFDELYWSDVDSEIYYSDTDNDLNTILQD